MYTFLVSKISKNKHFLSLNGAILGTNSTHFLNFRGLKVLTDTNSARFLNVRD